MALIQNSYEYYICRQTIHSMITFIKRTFMFNFNPNLASKISNHYQGLHDFYRQIGPRPLKPREIKPAKTNIFISTSMIRLCDMVVAESVLDFTVTIQLGQELAVYLKGKKSIRGFMFWSFYKLRTKKSVKLSFGFCVNTCFQWKQWYCGGLKNGITRIIQISASFLLALLLHSFTKCKEGPKS